MPVFEHGTRNNKHLGAAYVKQCLGRFGSAEIVENVGTGCGVNMTFGVDSEVIGLVHVTCTSNIDPNASIVGWSEENLAECGNFDYIAFVWGDKDDRVFVMILTRGVAIETCEEMQNTQSGQYSKNNIKSNHNREWSKLYDANNPDEAINPGLLFQVEANEPE